jgi:hypothetical protein
MYLVLPLIERPATDYLLNLQTSYLLAMFLAKASPKRENRTL